jgi:hypothetical protein
VTETRTRQRILLAIESRGYTIESISYEAPYYAGEKMGMGGGWWITVDRPYLENCFPGDELGGLSVDEVLADIDYWLKPQTPCDCDLSVRHPIIAGAVKGDPQRPVHDPECPHRLDYHLRWWPKGEQ